MGPDLMQLGEAALLLLLPAVVVFLIANARRQRGQKSKRQRITKRRSHRHTDGSHVERPREDDDSRAD